MKTGIAMPPMPVVAISPKVPPSWGPMIDLLSLTSEVAAAISEPVARVPMKESIFQPMTTMPLAIPMITPAAIVRMIAKPIGIPWLTRSQATITLQRPTALPTERSKTREDSGTISASATSPATAFWLSTVFAVCQVGKVSGAQIAKTTMIAAQT